ncbi:MAG: UvrD-helicase domain-containing protein [Chlamydiota bacterium]
MSFDVLAKNTSISGRCLLEASAGTGKTFSIQHLVVRLLLENKQRLEEILVVTFTKASTRELQARIRNNLEEVLSAYRRSIPLFPYMESCPPNEAIPLLEAALLSFEEARIHTIHGFCHQLLQENAFSLGFPLEMRVLEEKVREQKRRQFVREYLYALDQKGVHPAELLWLFQEKKSFRRVYQALERAPLLGEISTLQDWYQRLLNKGPILQEAFPWVENLEEMAQEAYPLYKKEGTPLVDLLSDARYLQKLVENRIHLTEFASWAHGKQPLFSHFDPTRRKQATKKPKELLENFCLWAQKELQPLFNSACSVERIVQMIGVTMRPEFSRFLEEEQDFSPDDLVLATERLLLDPDFLEKTALSFKAVIIDEFQDTDPTQWAIFSTLFGSCAEAFYLVGDPKQSIYGFRNADIYTYLQAGKTMDRRFYLQTNYRSHRDLIEGLNRFFSKKKDWLYLPKWKETLSYKPVFWAKEKGEAKLSFWLLQGASKRGIWPTKLLEEEALYPKIAQTLKAFRETKPQDTAALLVKDRFQGFRLFSYLEKRGIACSMKTSASLLDTPLYQAFYDVLQAIAKPLEEPLIKKALGATFFGRSLLTIGGMSLAEVEAAKGMFFLLQEELQAAGFSAFWPFFFSYRADGPESITIGEQLQEKSAYGEAREIVEHLLSVAEEFPFSLETLPLFWKRSSLIDEKAQVADEESVQIMTIHASKGLEFDLVIPVGLISRSPTARKQFPEIDAEKFRQLYVALTRAKNFLYVPVVFDLAQKKPEEGSASSMELFLAHSLGYEDLYVGIAESTLEKVEALLSELDLSYERLDPSSPVPLQNDPKDVPKLVYEKPPCFEKREQKMLSFSSLREAKDWEEERLESAPTSTLPLGTKTGILLHSLLENHLRKPNLDEIVVRESDLPLSYRPFQKEIEGLIKQALSMSLFPGGPSAKDLPLEQKYVEMEFTFTMEEAGLSPK